MKPDLPLFQTSKSHSNEAGCPSLPSFIFQDVIIPCSLTWVNQLELWVRVTRLWRRLIDPDVQACEKGMGWIFKAEDWNFMSLLLMQGGGGGGEAPSLLFGCCLVVVCQFGISFRFGLLHSRMFKLASRCLLIFCVSRLIGGPGWLSKCPVAWCISAVDVTDTLLSLQGIL